MYNQHRDKHTGCREYVTANYPKLFAKYAKYRIGYIYLHLKKEWRESVCQPVRFTPQMH